jgi:methionyl-tRNA formyltransferase
MMKNIVFMGTPDFAVEPLEALAFSDYNIVLVVTQPDRPRGRGQKSTPSPVKIAAKKLGVPVAQPEKLRGNDEFIEKLKKLNLDLIVVAAYGKILTKEILELPKCGCINIHASLLPKYRGAAPIHRAIEAGEKVTGVTLMRMSEGLDEGDILDSRNVEIGDSDTGELHDRLARAGAVMLKEDLDKLFAGTLEATPQDSSLATYAPPVNKDEGHIDFGMDAEIVLRRIRAMNPIPGAYAYLDGKKIKILAAHKGASDIVSAPGRVTGTGDYGIEVTVASGTVILDRVQLPGGKAMSAADFLRGHKALLGTLLE